MRNLLTICLLAGVIAAAPADASLITFKISGFGLGCDYGGGCDEFAEETGLPPPTDNNYADFSVTFTLDTAAAVVDGPEPHWGGEFLPHQRQVYSIDSPGTGLSISVGALTLFSSQFFVAIGQLDPGSSFSSDGYTNAFSIYSMYESDPRFFFNFGYIGNSIFSFLTLDELVAAPLSKFSGMAFNPAAVPGHIERPLSWNVTGGVRTIQRQSVPEPASFALLGIGLAGLATIRRLRAV